MPQQYTREHRITFLYLVLSVLLFSSACSPRTFSLVPDESQFKALGDEATREMVSTLLSKGTPQRGSTMHNLLARSTLRSTSFEQAFLFSEDSYRISLYAPNFSKLLYFAVTTPEGTLSCDVARKEAVISEDSGKVYLPELPPMLLNPENFKHLILGELPGSMFGEGSLPALEIRTFKDDQGNKESVVKGRIAYGSFEGLLTRVDDSSGENYYRLDKVILSPDNSKEAVLIEYSYSETTRTIPGLTIPKEIRLFTLERSLDITFRLNKISDELSGTKEALFSLIPPRGYQVYNQ